ncbi:TetR/AcrR family transcriptional regulator [Cohnella massiliensis]|uniref:TetR/AcrR family transcriptional regulator n=1 Tax=Cohnella massiliensis TaxID=1816691 RepID=UPI0009BA474D|nr:TetR/AcrR family transcriptional regulator [Cohnella massiliensis]
MDFREKIGAAAERVIREHGLAKTTTKQIAKAAGCSEGSLYNYFRAKEDLFLHVVRNQLTNFMGVLTRLPDRIGKGSVQDNLEEVAAAGLADFLHSMPLLCSVFSETSLLDRLREGMTERNEGPHRANEALAAYLSGEQRLGRIRAGVDPKAAADLLLGSCFQHAFQLRFMGMEKSEEERRQYVRMRVRELTHGIEA